MFTLYRRAGNQGQNAADRVLPSAAVSKIWHVDPQCYPVERHRKESGRLATLQVASLRQLLPLDLCMLCTFNHLSARR